MTYLASQFFFTIQITPKILFAYSRGALDSCDTFEVVSLESYEHVTGLTEQFYKHARKFRVIHKSNGE